MGWRLSPMTQKNYAEFRAQRASEIYRTFRSVLNSVPAGTSIYHIASLVSEAPSSRYWVSPERAAKVISIILRDADDHTTFDRSKVKPHKLRMFHSIIEACKGDYSMHNICCVVHSPAPQFFLPAHTIVQEYYREFKRLKQAKLCQRK
jgi:hypothetical protein